MTFGKSSSTPGVTSRIAYRLQLHRRIETALLPTFLVEVAQSIVVAFPHSLDAALNLKTHLGRASPLSRHARIPFRGTLA